MLDVMDSSAFLTATPYAPSLENDEVGGALRPDLPRTVSSNEGREAPAPAVWSGYG